ncbi:MAG: DNA gyrase subunit B, partial [Pseudomonadota bacterium]|nr:DNA gyrase subunit B [Pseudomonadota bacterium]
QYLKDDDALTGFLTQAALENSALHVNEDAPGITGEGLQAVVEEYRSVMATIDRLSRLYPADILEQLIYLQPLASDSLSNREAVEQWGEALLQRINETHNSGSHRYQILVKEDSERNLFYPVVEITAHGVPTEFIFAQDFFKSGEYDSMVKLGANLESLIEDGSFMSRGERRKEITSFKEGLEWLMTESRRGYNIQRYKGLGEMNPEQLWETTMDPDTRRMLQVTIEDAIAADQMFTCLMGDQVEPRREFIESNALAVANLDV